MKLKKLLSLVLICILIISSLSVLTAQASDYQLGDADKSAIVNIKDATLIQKAVAYIVTLNDEQQKLADVDASGDITVKDATAIQKWIAGIRVEYPIGGVEPPALPWSDADIAKMGEAIKAEAKGKPVYLKLWGPELAQDTLNKQATDFERMFSRYADIYVTVAVQGENDAATSLLNDPFTAADVLGIPSDQLDKLCYANVLSECMFSDEVKLANSAASVATATVGKDIFAYPETADNSYVLVYDKRYVSDKDAESWESLLNACKKSGKSFMMDALNGYYACTFLYTGGLKTTGMDYDTYTQQFNNYNINDVTASVQAFGTLFRNAGSTFKNADTFAIADGFVNGTVAAGVAGSWNFKSIEYALGDNAGFAKLPTININGTTTQSINMFGYKFLAVNAFSDYPDTSQILAYYLTNEDCQLERARELEWTPTNRDALNSNFVKNNKAMCAMNDQSKYSVPQRALAATFWDPVAYLGIYITDPYSNLSTSAVRNEVEIFIYNILDY